MKTTTTGKIQYPPNNDNVPSFLLSDDHLQQTSSMSITKQQTSGTTHIITTNNTDKLIENIPKDEGIRNQSFSNDYHQNYNKISPSSSPIMV